MAASSGPGWNSIQTVLQRVYGPESAWHFSPSSRPGEGSLAEIQVFAATEDRPHWHYVTLGLSELFQKESDDSDTSGFGFELTLRAVRELHEQEPPTWPVDLLHQLARRVNYSGCGYFPHQALHCEKFDEGRFAPAWAAVAFAVDSRLAHLETPNGRLSFLQVVPLFEGEFLATRDWCTAGVLELMQRESPLLVVDSARASLLESPAAVSELRRHVASEGSAQEIEFVSLARWLKRGPNMRITLGAASVPAVTRALAGRLPFGRSFLIAGQESSIALEPAESDGWRLKGELLVLSLSRQTAAAICSSLRPVGGEYTWPTLPGLVLEIASGNSRG